MVNPRTRKKLGRQIGADYMIYGEITSIIKKVGRKRDIYYKITLKLADIETGIIEWMDEKEIRKQAQKGIISFTTKLKALVLLNLIMGKIFLFTKMLFLMFVGLMKEAE